MYSTHEIEVLFNDCCKNYQLVKTIPLILLLKEGYFIHLCFIFIPNIFPYVMKWHFLVYQL